MGCFPTPPPNIDLAIVLSLILGWPIIVPIIFQTWTSNVDTTTRETTSMMMRAMKRKIRFKRRAMC